MPTTSYTIVGWCLSGYWQLLSFKPPKGTAEGKALRVSHLGKACSAARKARVLPTTWPHNSIAWNLRDRFLLTPHPTLCPMPNHHFPATSIPMASPKKPSASLCNGGSVPAMTDKCCSSSWSVQLGKDCGDVVDVLVQFWMQNERISASYIIHLRILALMNLDNPTIWNSIFSYRHCYCMIITKLIR